MHPNAFLRTFWRLELRPQVFVAMSFSEVYATRFSDVIEPAIASVRSGDIPLSAFRVDLSKTGDSILTDIIDGIAHSQLVLADVSSVGKDSVTGQAYRNGNVMYEVGIALACRQPAEVLLIRDDTEQFLFDVSTVPHKTIDFTDTGNAVSLLRAALEDRLNEQKYLDDARVEMALCTLNQGEIQILRRCDGVSPGQVFSLSAGGIVVNGIDVNQVSYVSRLLDKQLITVAAQPNGMPAYRLTRLGYAVVGRLVST